MVELAASRPVFAVLSALVEERTGLHYGPADREIFLDKVSVRAGEAGFDSLLDYYYYLRYDPGGEAEIAKLVDTLVVNETYFFRELQPLRVLVDRFLAPAVRAGKRPRIWSAACATGEEPLTLAMLLAEADLLGHVELIASDISNRALTRARSGCFGKRSLRDAADPTLIERWMRRDGDGWTVVPQIRDAIVWRRLNLCEPSTLAALGEFDVILCRNVLIYFSDETSVRTIQALTNALKPEGVLLVGVSESLLRFGTALACQEADQVFFYRKVA